MTKENKNVWKPDFRYETVSGTFIDYCGNNRDFTMVAVSIPVQGEDMTVIRPVEYEDEYVIPAKNVLNEETGEIEYVPETVQTFTDCYDDIVAPVAKMLTIGVAVRCVRDKDRGLGERIAYGKAITLMNHTLFVSHSGMINTKMVQALLEQEADHFRKDPGSYLIGYNNDKIRYMKTGKIAEAEMNIDEYNSLYNKNVKKTIEAEKISKDQYMRKVKEKLLDESKNINHNDNTLE